MKIYKVDIDISEELIFKTARSGGSGGQNVNKVETMVTGHWNIAESQLIGEDQKALLIEKLNSRINKEGTLSVKSQVHRSQLANKEEVVKKINELVQGALKKKKPRIATRLSKAAKEKRMESKKKEGEKKALRGKITNY